DRTTEALQLAETALRNDPLDFGARNELSLLGVDGEKARLQELMGSNAHSYLAIAADYAHAGFYPESIDLLERCTYQEIRTRAPGHVEDCGMPNATPMVSYFQGYYAALKRDQTLAQKCRAQAMKQSAACCFPNSLDSILALQAACQANPRDGRASFYL